MKILVFSNFYPPHHIGGYELGCSKIVQLLQKKHHQCHVLASNFGNKFAESEKDVSRLLEHSFYETDTPRRLGRLRSFLLDLKNRWRVRKIMQRFKPDVIFIFNPMSLTPGALIQAASSNVPTCCLVSDEWMCNWTKKENRHYSRLLSLFQIALIGWIPKLLFRSLGLSSRIDLPSFGKTIFVSDYLRTRAHDCGIATEKSVVVHWGIDRNKFLFDRKWEKPARSILFCGQVSPHKGPETAVFAMARIKQRHPNCDIKLTLAGRFSDLAYKEKLEQLVFDLGLKKFVSFSGPTAHSDIPVLMRVHDIFVFPSVWQEPFSIVLVEAMTSGLAVVSTNTGGTQEMLRDGVNGMRFEPNDADHCASCILDLINDRDLCKQISNRAVISTVNFTIDKMVDEIELSIIRTVEQGATRTSAGKNL